MPNASPPDYVTPVEGAEALGLPVDEVRKWLKKGLLLGKDGKTSGRVFRLSDLENLRDRLEGKGANTYQILKDEPSGFRAIELFSGCGGLALGFENAGLESVLLVENDKRAVETLEKNFPEKEVFGGNVEEVDFQPYRGTVDVVAGGFPCQAFSYAGNSRGFEDTRGTLFFEFARCVKEVRPKIAVGENVRGLLNHDGGRTLETMVAVLQGLGYRVAYRVLRAQFLDVPQKRERLVIIAVRDDLGIPIFYPREQSYTVTLREALAGVPESEGQTYPPKKFGVLEQVPEGGYWKDLPDSVQREYMGASYHLGGGKTGMARRLGWNEPSLTLTCSPAQKQTERCHPEETRPLTTREYARIQTFPDEWEFAGKPTAVYKQIGNAVPVNLGFHIGRSIVTMLSRIDDANPSIPATLLEEPPRKKIDPQMVLDLSS